MQGYHNSREHLFEELHRLDLMLNLRTARQRRDPAYAGFTEFRGLFITEEEIDSILDQSQIKPVSGLVSGEDDLRSLSSSLRQVEEQIALKTVAAEEGNVPLTLRRLAEIFHLSPFEIDALLVCLAPELDLKYEKLYAYLQNDVTRKRPSVDLILNLFCRSLAEKLQARIRFSSEAPLIRHQLLVYAGDAHNEQATLLSRFLKIDDRILNFLIDVEALDEQLISFTMSIAPRVTLEELLLPAELAENLARLFHSQFVSTAANGKCSGQVFLFHGPGGTGKKFTAEALCQSVGINLLIADLPQMLSNGSATASLASRLFREATLSSAAVYLDHAEVLIGESEKAGYAQRVLLKTLEEFSGVAFIGSEQPLEANPDQQTERFFKIAFPVPVYPLRRQLWDTLITQGNHRVAPEVDLGVLADKFIFTPGKIRSAVAAARQLSLTHKPHGNGEISTADLYQACRDQSSIKLAALARKITPLYTWQDIILPCDRLAHLQEICAHVKHRQQVFGVWGFNRKISLGKGLSVLFVGPSGTGKTMAAEIMAGELGLDLYKIDLSGVVSKYIGETEKNLSKIFQEAEQSNAILFFDEADAIFGKRSEVKDSHDRYANIEINYLLQKMEEYEGIVILASNFQKNIDQAFTRRLRFVVEFPFPDEEYRRRIWKIAFPRTTPLEDDIDFEFLAEKFKISGGNIKNIALGAAFLAAANAGVVNMEHIIRATKREFQKMGRLCVKTDFDQYFEFVQSEEVSS